MTPSTRPAHRLPENVLTDDVLPEASRLTWRKSSFSNGAGGMCVEVAHGDDMTAIRDSKDPHGGLLVFAPQRWGAFLADARAGAFDLDR